MILKAGTYRFNDVLTSGGVIVNSAEVNPPSYLAEITYNGETIAQLNAGETCTIKCAGLPMETDIIIKINEVN